jgi:hypothetical protein
MKSSNAQEGMRVRVAYLDASSMVEVPGGYQQARKVDATGILVRELPGADDLWIVHHNDGSDGVYWLRELEEQSDTQEPTDEEETPH